MIYSFLQKKDKDTTLALLNKFIHNRIV